MPNYNFTMNSNNNNSIISINSNYSNMILLPSLMLYNMLNMNLCLYSPMFLLRNYIYPFALI